MKRHNLVKMSVLLSALVIFILLSAASSQAIKYRFEDLGHLNGTQVQNFYYKEADINESGTVVGRHQQQRGDSRVYK